MIDPKFLEPVKLEDIGRSDSISISNDQSERSTNIQIMYSQEEEQYLKKIKLRTKVISFAPFLFKKLSQRMEFDDADIFESL